MTSSSARLQPMWALHECVDKRRPLTSLVLQMSSSVDPQALPGVAFHGIIPGAMKFIVHVHSKLLCYANNKVAIY